MSEKLYRPSNSTDGCAFYAKWCENCAKDKHMSEGKDYDECSDDEVCQIIADTLAYPIQSPKYPKAWTYDKDGHPCCTEFVEVGQKMPHRCAKTEDMFA